jgi:DNA-binding NtrC family response regulator
LPIPVIDARQTRDSSQRREKAPIRVLIVDDEPLIRWSLRQGFARRGHLVTTACNALDAMTCLERAATPFDAVILDYRLPDRQDLSLLEDVRRASPGSLVLMMTAFADDGMKAAARDRGAHAVLDKPFQIRSLVEMIEAAVVA